LILRALGHFHYFYVPWGGGNNVDYMSFLHGAELFFLLSIASWCRSAKA
jgi:hypothetical protein